MTTKYVSKLQPELKMTLKKSTNVEVTAEVDRRILDKNTGEIRVDKRTVTVPKENWKFWVMAYEEVNK